MRDARDGLVVEIRDRGYKHSAIAIKSGLTEQQLSDILNKRRKLDANEMFRIWALPILWWIATKSVLFLLLKNWKEKGVTPPFLYSCCPRYLQTPILPGLHYWTSSEFF